MTSRLRLSRRQLFGLLLSTTVALPWMRGALGGPLDQGIGGTGAAPPRDESDRGIGGTGVIGTIRKFGSIIVNDLRITYPPDASVRIDGQPATVRDLKIGQVVRVGASGTRGSLSTNTINVTSEVVGPVERAAKGRMVVLGQSVSTAGLKHPQFAVGDTVAVSGLRRNDGTIVASLVERRDGAPSRVAGPIRVGSDGALRIGGLALSGADGTFVGQRTVLEGTLSDNRFVVSHAVPEASLLPPDVRTLSIESYVERQGDRLSLGSGFDVSGTPTSGIPAGRSVRAVLSTSIGNDGRLTLDSLRANGHTFSSGRSEPHGGLNGHGSGRPRGEGSGGRRPMDFGPSGRPSGGPLNGGADPRGFGGPGGLPGGGFGGLPGGPGGGPPGGGSPGGGFGGGGFGGGGIGGGRR